MYDLMSYLYSWRALVLWEAASIVKAKLRVGAIGIVQGFLARWSTVCEKPHQLLGLYTGLYNSFGLGYGGCCCNQSFAIEAGAVVGG
eukprot:11315236-Ditylum_brightwellii.AAC.1